MTVQRDLADYKLSRNTTRFLHIRDSYGSFDGKSLVDIGCEDGFFGKKFLRYGGERFVGLDIDPDYPEYNITLDSIKNVKFDIGFYLNLHYHEDTDTCGYLQYLRSNCKVLFTSCRRGGHDPLKDQDNYLEKLNGMFGKVVFIHEDGDKIYRCE